MPRLARCGDGWRTRAVRRTDEARQPPDCRTRPHSRPECAGLLLLWSPYAQTAALGASMACRCSRPYLLQPLSIWNDCGWLLGSSAPIRYWQVQSTVNGTGLERRACCPETRPLQSMTTTCTTAGVSKPPSFPCPAPAAHQAKRRGNAPQHCCTRTKLSKGRQKGSAEQLRRVACPCLHTWRHRKVLSRQRALHTIKPPGKHAKRLGLRLLPVLHSLGAVLHSFHALSHFTAAHAWAGAQG